MNSFYSNGYQETIQKGLSAVRSFRSGISTGTGSRTEQIERLKKEIESADAIVIGAGAGLSTAAGLTYSGERFDRYFGDFAARFGIQDIYSGGFYPFPDEETRWAWWVRHIYYNRYIDPPKDVYGKLLALVQGKDYFVITTNVDHQFQRAGFDKKRLFYTQGDYGLFQSVNPANQKTYDNEEWVMQAMEIQGFVMDADGVYQIPQGGVSMKIPTELVPKCPDDGSDMIMNLRADDSFVEDKGWHKASAAYAEFIRRHEKLHTLYLEIGVGANTPVIIKYPFWEMTRENKKAVYACLNRDEIIYPKEIIQQSICIRGDAGEILQLLQTDPMEQRSQ
jgi:NAD-dependent SIR2 family protein deacetylase